MGMIHSKQCVLQRTHNAFVCWKGAVGTKEYVEDDDDDDDNRTPTRKRKFIHKKRNESLKSKQKTEVTTQQANEEKDAEKIVSDRDLVESL